ncbi:MAG: hypothetical protein IH613_09870 [Desulfuromonadales bacterium]|nr:hypothetical protein [Desulfuromonadales bacterium]
MSLVLKGHQKRYQWVLPVLLLLVLSLVFCLPLLTNLYSSSSGDWDYFMFLYEVPSITFFEYQQFPLWNPYCGGGLSLIGNPQAGHLSPIFLITSLFGVVAGLKIAVWLHTFIGLWGMWLLSGHLGMAGSARLATSFVFMFSGAWALHIAAGHIVWLPATLLPLFFLTFLKGLSNKWWLCTAAAIESIMFYEGGTYVFAFSLVFVCIYASVYSLENKTFQPVMAFVMVNLLAAALSAPKLLPVVELLQSHPRPTSVGSSIPLDIYFSFFIDRFKGLERSLNNTGWWAFGSYLGIVVISLYLFSLTLFKSNKALILSSMFLLLLSMGNFGTFSPWNILHELPVFSGFKVPTRVLLVFCFTVALLVGRSLTHLKRESHARSRLLVGILVIFILCDLFSVSAPILGNVSKSLTTPYWHDIRSEQNLEEPKLYKIPPETSSGLWQSIPSVHQPFTQVSIPFSQRNVHGAWSNQYLPLLQNKGVVDAYETIPFQRYAAASTDDEYIAEYYLTGDGSVSLKKWSPNKLVFHIDSKSEDRLVINQNYDKGWRASHGVLTSHKGLLSVGLPPGDYEFIVYYLPTSFLIGLVVFIITLSVILLSFAAMRVRPGESKSSAH